MSINVHIVNHTHWDREWFLTSEYTSRWIPGLIRSLEQRVASRPTYHYLLDGQTLVVEDLLQVAPEMEPTLQVLVENGHLTIGPYYSQPDWQLGAGELLVRNLLYGMQDTRKYGGTAGAGWLVDTFGHISQAPQIHALFDLQALYVWRGVPELVPYFEWQGVDGSQILTINLFGGYRNLYGVTHVPEVAVRRLAAEVARLRPFYPTPDIPLFDGYDLEDDPEDPLVFYAQADGLDPEIELHEATPASFANLVAGNNLPLPVLHGELNSGKYGATFPGAFSARTYLKIMAHDCQELLFRRCEPLAALASLCGFAYPAEHFEQLGRLLLQNGVHDCICGVSIDPVHEKMAWSYRRAFDDLQAILQQALAHLLAGFAPGEYAVSTNPFVSEAWCPVEDGLWRLESNGVGIWPVTVRLPLEALPPEREISGDFTWSNDHYVARLQPDGRLCIDDSSLGELRVFAENGDTYSDERGAYLGNLLPAGPARIVARSAGHCILEYECAWQSGPAWASARVRLTLDPTPLLRCQIDLDSSGTDLRVEMCFATARQGDIWAGMPYDLVVRPEVDTDLLPRQPASELSSILLGQRELDEVRTFPFHDLVAISDQEGSSVVFARGLHAYQAESGVLYLTLRRSVEWLTRADLQHRIGDAGPFFYVPGARCERRVRHELAFASLPHPATTMVLQSLNAAFQNPPLVVQAAGGGELRSWEVFQENLPISSLQAEGSALLARFYNPTPQEAALSRAYPQADVWGKAQGASAAVPPKKIANLQLNPIYPGTLEAMELVTSPVELLNQPEWRVGPSHGAPDLAVLAELEEKIVGLDAQLSQVAIDLSRMLGAAPEMRRARLRLEHRQYALQRERLEYHLSLLLNRRALEYGGETPREVLYRLDPEIAAVGKELNRLRIKRRIYDYVVQAMD